MDLLKTILDPIKLKTSCFLCFKNCENMSNLLRKFTIFIDYRNFDMRLKDIISYLFPSHDIMSDQACVDCVDSLVKMFILLQRNFMMKIILEEITNRLTDEVNNVNTNLLHDKLQINLKLPIYKEVERHKQGKFFSCVTKKSVISNDTVTPETLLPTSLNCKKCVMVFSTHNMLKEHMKGAHNNTNKAAICEFCGKDCKKTSTLKAHLNSHYKSTCPYCFKELKSHSHFKLHVKSHETKSKVTKARTKIYYNCKICSFKSLNKPSLEGHINKVHLQIRPHVCEVCNKGFYRKSNLIEHISTHGESVGMTCEQCGCKFLYKKTLIEHLRLHTGEKPFQCEICKECFVTSGRRANHFKRKHMEKNIFCSICDKKFSLNSELNTHFKKYHCSVTNKLPNITKECGSKN